MTRSRSTPSVKSQRAAFHTLHQQINTLRYAHILELSAGNYLVVKTVFDAVGTLMLKIHVLCLSVCFSLTVSSPQFVHIFEENHLKIMIKSMKISFDDNCDDDDDVEEEEKEEKEEEEEKEEKEEEEESRNKILISQTRRANVKIIILMEEEESPSRILSAKHAKQTLNSILFCQQTRLQNPKSLLSLTTGNPPL